MYRRKYVPRPKSTGGAKTRKSRTYNTRANSKGYKRKNSLMAGMSLPPGSTRQKQEIQQYIDCDSADRSAGGGQINFKLVSGGSKRYFTGVSLELTLEGPMTGDVVATAVCHTCVFQMETPQVVSPKVSLVSRE